MQVRRRGVIWVDSREAGREGKASCKHPDFCLFIIEGDKEIFVYFLVLRVDAGGGVCLWMKFWECLRAYVLVCDGESKSCCLLALNV